MQLTLSKHERRAILKQNTNSMNPESNKNHVDHVNPVQKTLRQDLQDLQDISRLTQIVIGCAFNVYNTLGFGFLESVYEKSMLIELQKHTIKATAQSPIKVYYDSQMVGDFFADILIEDQLIIELKSVTQLNKMHEMQLVNYLNATGIEDGLLINFGPQKTEVKRKFKTYEKTS